MNKTFNINLGSYPFAIDEDAYEYIQDYLGTIRKHFSASDGCEEILYDIEVRMAELFQEHLKGRAIISMKEIDEVIMIMGKPEDFGAEPMSDTYNASGRAKPSHGRIQTGKRLFRDPDDQKIGGVCSGISAYLGIEDPLWIRLIFALLFFTGGIGVITYIILWALVPEASNAGDKLSMRGEPATIQNIAKVVEEELTEFGDKINEWSKDLGSKKKSNGTSPGFTAKSVLANGLNIFATVGSGIFIFLRKFFTPVITVLSVIVLSLLGLTWAASFVGLSFASPILFAAGPDSGFLSYLGIGSLFFTVGLPILGIMLFLARIAFGYRVHKNVKTGFWTAWFLSLFTTSFAAMSTVKEYSNVYEYRTTSDYNIDSKEISLVMPEENIDHSMGIHIGKFFTEKDDKWAFRDVNIMIEKSKDQAVHIEKHITARGESQNQAQENTLYVNNDLTVTGNQISISKFLTFPKNKKFRNQQIEYTLYIPEGKIVTFDNHSKERMKESSVISWDKIYGNTENMKWVMTSNGLKSDAWENIHHFKKEITSNSFTSIIVENGFDVVITKSDIPSVTVEGNKSDVESIGFNNINKTFSIGSGFSSDPDGILIRINAPSLEMIQLDGVHTAKIEGFSQDKLKMICTGYYDDNDDTEIDFTGSIKSMDISMDGTQTLRLTGNGVQLNLDIASESKIIADKYIVKEAVWKGDGKDGSILHVTETFSTSEPDDINIKLLGNPKRTKLQ